MRVITQVRGISLTQPGVGGEFVVQVEALTSEGHSLAVVVPLDVDERDADVITEQIEMAVVSAMFDTFGVVLDREVDTLRLLGGVESLISGTNRPGLDPPQDVEELLATVELDLNSTDRQNLYTVPLDKRMIPTRFVYSESTVNFSFALGVTFAIGFNNDANNVVQDMPINTLPLGTPTQYYVGVQGAGGPDPGAKIGESHQHLAFKLDSALDSGNTMVIRVFGIVIEGV